MVDRNSAIGQTRRKLNFEQNDETGKAAVKRRRLEMLGERISSK